MEKQFFWVDKPLKEVLSQIPKGEKSIIIRIALRDYFGLTDSKRGKVWYTEDDLETAIEGREENE